MKSSQTRQSRDEQIDTLQAARATLLSEQWNVIDATKTLASNYRLLQADLSNRNSIDSSPSDMQKRHNHQCISDLNKMLDFTQQFASTDSVVKINTDIMRLTSLADVIQGFALTIYDSLLDSSYQNQSTNALACALAINYELDDMTLQQRASSYAAYAHFRAQQAERHPVSAVAATPVSSALSALDNSSQAFAYWLFDNETLSDELEELDEKRQLAAVNRGGRLALQRLTAINQLKDLVPQIDNLDARYQATRSELAKQNYVLTTAKQALSQFGLYKAAPQPQRAQAIAELKALVADSGIKEKMGQFGTLDSNVQLMVDAAQLKRLSATLHGLALKTCRDIEQETPLRSVSSSALHQTLQQVFQLDTMPPALQSDCILQYEHYLANKAKEALIDTAKGYACDYQDTDEGFVPSTASA